MIFKRHRKEEFRFYASKTRALLHLISVMQTERLLRKKTCQGYFVCLATIPSKELALDKVSVTDKYDDLFSNDLPGVPIDR